MIEAIRLAVHYADMSVHGGAGYTLLIRETSGREVEVHVHSHPSPYRIGDMILLKEVVSDAEYFPQSICSVTVLW